MLFLDFPEGKNEQLNVYSELVDLTNGFIAGGAIRCLFDNTKLRDIDIMFETELDFEKACECFNISPNFHNGNSNNFAIEVNYKDKYIVNLCKTKFAIPEAIIKDFDFDCCNAIFTKDKKIIATSGFVESTKSKKLTISNELNFPFGALLRLQKYIKYGYDIPLSTLYKIASGINNTKSDDLYYKKSEYKQDNFNIDDLF